tara:strand:+ start:347 stop:475 length:129 start_codon:yes stop_codon:yes gene_type:complete
MEIVEYGKEIKEAQSQIEYYKRKIESKKSEIKGVDDLTNPNH